MYREIRVASTGYNLPVVSWRGLPEPPSSWVSVVQNFAQQMGDTPVAAPSKRRYASELRFENERKLPYPIGSNAEKAVVAVGGMWSGPNLRRLVTEMAKS